MKVFEIEKEAERLRKMRKDISDKQDIYYLDFILGMYDMAIREIEEELK